MRVLFDCALGLTCLIILGGTIGTLIPTSLSQRATGSGGVSSFAVTLPQAATSTLLFVGDLMFDRYIRERAHSIGYDGILHDVCSTTQAADLTVGNLEGPVTSRESVANYHEGGPNHYMFTFASTTLDALVACGFDALSLANNHILNFGSEGVRETRDYLSTRAVSYFGDPHAPYEPAYRETPSGRVALFGYNQFGHDDPALLAERLRNEPAGTFVVVMPHWGEEYDTLANERERNLARLWVDAGADLVVGAHPHVVQDNEVYHGVPIYYSLGNFVFDQYFSDDVRCGRMLTVEFSEAGVVTHTDDIRLERDGRTVRASCSTTTSPVTTNTDVTSFR